MVILVFLWGLCGYTWVNTLTLSPQGDQFVTVGNKLAYRYPFSDKQALLRLRLTCRCLNHTAPQCLVAAHIFLRSHQPPVCFSSTRWQHIPYVQSAWGHAAATCCCMGCSAQHCPEYCNKCIRFCVEENCTNS